MREETVTKQIPVFRTICDEYGEVTAVEQTGTETISVTTLYADEGKCIVRQGENINLGTVITLGTNESADIYTESSFAV